MSTKPPTAVMMPRVSSSGFKSVLDLLQLVGMRAKLPRRRIVGLGEKRPTLHGIARVRPRQRGCVGLELLAQLLPHRFHVNGREVTARCFLVDERPLGPARARR